MRKHIKEKRIRELGFLHLVRMKPRQGLGRENSLNSICRFVLFLHLRDPVVRTPVSANPGLNFNPGFFLFFIKSTLWDNFLYSF